MDKTQTTMLLVHRIDRHPVYKRMVSDGIWPDMRGYDVRVLRDVEENKHLDLSNNKAMRIAFSNVSSSGRYWVCISEAAVNAYATYPMFIRFILQHELGHIVLGHLLPTCTLSRNKQEAIADLYALENCPLTIEEVNHMFDISDSLFGSSGNNYRRNMLVETIKR